MRQLAYRAWASSPADAVIPPIELLSDPKVHACEHERALRRAQNGVYDVAVTHREPGLRLAF